jgi:non-specific serine/threonine protein kinase
MLETIHEFAAERLAESGEEEEIRRRHAAFVRALAEDAEPHLMGEGQAMWLERLELEHDNIRAALDWSVTTGDAETALRTGAAIWRFWQLNGHLAEGRTRLERILANPGASTRNALRARALGALGGIRYWQADYGDLESVYREAVDIAREVGDRRLLSRALFDLSFVPLVTAQDFERQERILEEARGEADPGDRALQAQLLSGVSFSRMLQGGDPAELERPIEEALAIHRELGDPLLTAENILTLAGFRLLSGDMEAARDGLRQVVAMLAGRSGSVMLMIALYAAAVLEANTSEQPVRAARLFGAVNRLKDEGGGSPPSFVMTTFLGDPEAKVRATLGEEAFEQAHSEGYAMTTKQAHAYVLEIVG